MSDKLIREAWLRSAVDLLSIKLFEPNGIKLPVKLQVSIGIPYGRKGKKGSSHAIGQCWHAKCSAGGQTEIFIHPEIADGFKAIEILAHELVHAAGAWDHKTAFKELATKIGLTGKMTATVAGEQLTRDIELWVKALPKFPHDALDIYGGAGDGPKKQGTRMLAVTCPDCGYKVRTTAKWLEVGVPVCPCGADMVPAGQKE